MHKITKTYTRLSRLMLATAFTLTSLTAAAQTDNMEAYTRDSTMNALDYTLQRPLPSRQFEKKRFGDRLFLSIEGGADWIRASNSYVGADPGSPGFRGAISVGDWITPVHGWRLSVGGGRHLGADDQKPYFGSLSLDYMMNLSALLRGENPSRRFEMIGLIGLEGEALHRSGHKMWASGGLRFGLQPRVYLNNSTYLYIEPRIGIFTDGLDNIHSWHNYDWNASLMVGLGYRLNGGRGSRSVDNSLWIDDCFRDNMFIGFSGGVNFLGSWDKNIRHNLAANGSVFIGKWFTPSSGLRLQASGLQIKEAGYPNRRGLMADIDYLWNINSTMNGYDPDRAIEANILFGFSAAYTTESGTKIFPGFHFGAQGIWNVSPSVGLFIEPSIRGFQRSFTYGQNKRFSLLSSVSLGLVYRFRGSEIYRSYRNTFDYNDFLSSRRYFLEAGAGLFKRFSDWYPNFKVRGAFGKWFTPESAWRVSGEYAQLTGHQDGPYRSVMLGGDYILNLSTLASGFDDERPFDLDIFAGPRIGIAHYNGGKNSMIFGAQAGLRGRFRVSDGVDIFIEPSLGLTRIPDYANHKFSSEGTLMAGVIYNFGRRSSSERAQSSPSDNTSNFLNFSIGPNLFSETVYYNRDRRFTWSMDISGGHWFNEVSGIQGGLAYDMIPRHSEPGLYVGYIHADYMLNLTGLFTGSRSGRVSFALFGGPGIGWSNLSRYVSPVAHAGIEARIRLSPKLDFTLRPAISVWMPRLEPGAKNNHNFAGTGTLPVGISYRF